MDMNTIIEIVYPVVVALITTITAVASCAKAVSSIKKAKAEITDANSATEVRKLRKAIEDDSAAIRGAYAENRNLLLEMKNANEQTAKLLSHYDTISGDHREIMTVKKSVEAAIADQKTDMEGLINYFKKTVIEMDRSLSEIEIKNADFRKESKADIEAIHASIEVLNARIDRIVANWRAR